MESSSGDLGWEAGGDSDEGWAIELGPTDEDQIVDQGAELRPSSVSHAACPGEYASRAALPGGWP
jgi:hypothetical protein